MALSVILISYTQKEDKDNMTTEEAEGYRKIIACYQEEIEKIKKKMEFILAWKRFTSWDTVEEKQTTYYGIVPECDRNDV